jgi:hypothetical protein
MSAKALPETILVQPPTRSADKAREPVPVARERPVSTARRKVAGRTQREHERVLRGNPRDWYDVYKDTFDYLYQNEPTAFLNVTVHACWIWNSSA